jgi:hypothetical protein
MTMLDMPTAELLDRGYRALLQELGPAGFIRFVQHFRPGVGDYTAERHTWLPPSVDDVRRLLATRPTVPEKTEQSDSAANE